MRAVTRPLSEFTDRVPDLNDVAADDGVLFVRGGSGLAGRGIARRVGADAAVDLLGSIDHDSTIEGAAPLAVGSVPFRPGSASDLIIPAVTIVKRDDRIWVTAIDGADVDAVLAPPPEPLPVAPQWTIGQGVAVGHYLAAVAAARDAVRNGDLVKAVIARPVDVTAATPISIHAVLRRLKATFSSSYRFSVDGFVGASPELLVDVDGAVVRSHPLAGTTPRTGDVDNDARLASELQASAKNQIEHRVVIDDVHDRLLPFVSYLDWEPEPSIVTVANVQHLGTRMEGLLSQPSPTAIDLVRLLCPTPALGGHPRTAAISLIERVEGFERGRYGGAVGWVDAGGNGTWAVAIRCAEFSEDRRAARLVAGGGIVADSEPLAELAETQAKFQAMLSAIIRP